MFFRRPITLDYISFQNSTKKLKLQYKLPNSQSWELFPTLKVGNRSQLSHRGMAGEFGTEEKYIKCSYMFFTGEKHNFIFVYAKAVLY